MQLPHRGIHGKRFTVLQAMFQYGETRSEADSRPCPFSLDEFILDHLEDVEAEFGHRYRVSLDIDLTSNETKVSLAKTRWREEANLTSSARTSSVGR